MDYFLQTSTNVQAILVLMAALVKTRLADTFVSVLQATREKTVKPVSNYIRDKYLRKAGASLYGRWVTEVIVLPSYNITRFYVKFLTRVAGPLCQSHQNVPQRGKTN